jgi:hypothetical protein
VEFHSPCCRGAHHFLGFNQSVRGLLGLLNRIHGLQHHRALFVIMKGHACLTATHGVPRLPKLLLGGHATLPGNIADFITVVALQFPTALAEGCLRSDHGEALARALRLRIIP